MKASAVGHLTPTSHVVQRRGAICVANSYNGLGESTVVLQKPGSDVTEAYVLGVPAMGAPDLEDVSQQVGSAMEGGQNCTVTHAGLCYCSFGKSAGITDQAINIHQV